MKLEEAEFFLDLAEKSQDNVKVFSFFINAFFAAATSIRVGKGVMKTEYRNNQGFKAWLQKARDDLNVKFPIDFWVDKTRLGIIDNEREIEKVVGRGRFPAFIQAFGLPTPAMSRRYPNQARPPARRIVKKIVAQIYVVDSL